MKKLSILFLLCFFIFSCEDNDLKTTEETLIIASKKVDCTGVAAQKCLLVKNNKTQNWIFFYDSISGFTYEEGFEYEIVVLQKEIENPPQDASSIETILIKVISKIKKTSENLPI